MSKNSYFKQENINGKSFKLSFENQILYLEINNRLLSFDLDFSIIDVFPVFDYQKTSLQFLIKVLKKDYFSYFQLSEPYFNLENTLSKECINIVCAYNNYLVTYEKNCLLLKQLFNNKSYFLLNIIQNIEEPSSNDVIMYKGNEINEVNILILNKCDISIYYYNTKQLILQSRLHEVLSIQRVSDIIELYEISFKNNKIGILSYLGTEVMNKKDYNKEFIINEYEKKLLNKELEIQIKINNLFTSFQNNGLLSQSISEYHSISNQVKYCNLKINDISKLQLLYFAKFANLFEIKEEELNVTLKNLPSNIKNYMEYKELKRTTNPHKTLFLNKPNITINIASIESDENEEEKNKLYELCNSISRQKSSSIAYGALKLGTIINSPNELLTVIPLNDTIKSKVDSSTFTINNPSLLTYIEELNSNDCWNEFHNGVSHILQIDRSYLSDNCNKLRTWIQFNKSNSNSKEHGGFIYGLGLLNLLGALLRVDIYIYLKDINSHLAIGTMLGIGLSNIGKQSTTFISVFSIYISALSMALPNLFIPSHIQSAAMISIGLLLFKSSDEEYNKNFLNLIPKRVDINRNYSTQNVEEFKLSIAFTVGLINFSNNNHYVKQYIIDKLSLIKCNTIIVSEKYDYVNMPIPLLLTLMLNSFNTKDQYIYDNLPFPKTYEDLDFYTINEIFYFTLCRNLVFYDNIPTDFLLIDNITIHDYSHNNSSLLSSTKHIMIAANIYSLSIKYSGTSSELLRDSIIKYLDYLEDNVKFTTNYNFSDYLNKKDEVQISKSIYEFILNVCSMALGLIMSGSGDLTTYKTQKAIRLKLKKMITLSYGTCQYLHLSMTFLFLGKGNYKISSSNLDNIPFILMSSLPIFATSANDNSKYLQVLRHFYVKALEKITIKKEDNLDNDDIVDKLSFDNKNIKEVIINIITSLEFTLRSEDINDLSAILANIKQIIFLLNYISLNFSKQTLDIKSFFMKMFVNSNFFEKNKSILLTRNNLLYLLDSFNFNNIDDYDNILQDILINFRQEVKILFGKTEISSFEDNRLEEAINLLDNLSSNAKSNFSCLLTLIHALSN